jgi:hypothetical protein
MWPQLQQCFGIAALEPVWKEAAVVQLALLKSSVFWDFSRVALATIDIGSHKSHTA